MIEKYELNTLRWRLFNRAAWSRGAWQTGARKLKLRQEILTKLRFSAAMQLFISKPEQ